MTRVAAGIGTGGGTLLAMAPLLALSTASGADDLSPKLTIADLAAYRAALSEPRGAAEVPQTVGFRALWNHPATYQGHRVRVQGRLVRRFRQGSFGTFPPLEEAWVVSPAGDPFCLVFPASGDTSEAKAKTRATTPGGTGQGPVRFTGTFLKLLEYQGADGMRLAPLIVGPAPPLPVAGAAPAAPESNAPWGAETRLDWAIALAAAMVVAAVLAQKHMRRPAQPLKVDLESTPAPLFDDDPPPRRIEPQ
jgi:hypothetical protein